MKIKLLINVNGGGVKQPLYKEFTVFNRKKGGRKW